MLLLLRNAKIQAKIDCYKWMKAKLCSKSLNITVGCLADAHSDVSVSPAGSGSDSDWILVHRVCPPSSTALSEPEIAPDWIEHGHDPHRTSKYKRVSHFEPHSPHEDHQIWGKLFNRCCAHFNSFFGRPWVLSGKNYLVCSVKLLVAFQSYRCAEVVNGQQTVHSPSSHTGTKPALFPEYKENIRGLVQ